MKTMNLFMSLIVAACLASISAPAHADTLDGESYSVPTDTQPRGALLEEFTGIHCGYCPDGHAIARQLDLASERVYVVAIHAGYYAVPSLDQPDFRVDEGEELAEEFGTDSFGYPCGMVNRYSLVGRGTWKSYCKEAVEDTASVNLLATAAYDGSTRELTVRVEGYFTAAEQAEDQRLNVLWTQSNILGPQNGGLMGDEYVQRYMLRGYISQMWGDTINAPAQGTYFSREYTMTLPEAVKDVAVNAEDIEVIAFVTEGRRKVCNVTGCKPDYSNYSKPLAAELSEPLIPIDNYWGCNFFEAKVKNNSDATLTEATFSVNVNGTATTATWTGEIAPFDEQEITIHTQYDVIDNSMNSYSITLLTLNGEQVEPLSLSGSFYSLREATPTISLTLKTNSEADENTYRIKDADGQTVVELGPYPKGTVSIYEESVTLEANKIYCLEIHDLWGDGIYSPAGYAILRSEDGSLIDQIYSIDGFGTRTVFRTSKTVDGISDATSVSGSDAEIVVCRIDGIVVYRGPRGLMSVTPGMYIVYDTATRTVSKEVISK